MVSSANNPSLCQACQIWNNIESFNDYWPIDYEVSFTLDEMAADPACMICAIAKSSVERRLSTMGISSFSAVRVNIAGPNYLVLGEYPNSPFVSQISISNSTKIEVRVLLLLWVTLDSTAPFNAGVAPSFSIQPQILLIYSKKNLFLRSIDVRQWKASSFSTPLLNRLFLRLGLQNHRTRFLNFKRATSSHLVRVQPWETPFFDVALLKQWLLGCASLHGEQCRKNLKINLNNLPSGFRLINLKSMNVEQATSNKGFVALSYMWPLEKDSERVQLEKKNLKLLEQPGGLAHIPLPPVISDAMLLCQKLGETYIWIDRFCIIQDDAASKHDQVSGMHQIFRSASFTIVAALNDKNALGLSGFTNRPRISSIDKPEKEFEGEFLAVEKGFKAVDNSLWNTRGWTFQERLLSSRRIYITEHEVQYECCVGYAFEDLTHSATYKTTSRSLSHPKPKRVVGQLPGFFTWSEYSREINFHITNQTTIVDYMNWVADYTARKLSYASDILNAFSGVEGSLKSIFGSVFYYGIPEKYLHIALMWVPNSNIFPRITRPPIPSWSWASVITGSNYHWLSIGSREDITVTTLVYFHYQTPENGLQRLNVQEWWMGKEMPLEDFRNRDDVPSMAPGRKWPSKARNDRTWRECPQNPWQTLQRQALDPQACRVAVNLPGCLVFNTTIATVKLRKYQAERAKDFVGSFSVEKDMKILYNGEQQLGHLNNVPSCWQERIEGSEDGNGDIIVISGTLASYKTRQRMQHSLWDEQSGAVITDFDMWQLLVMLIERDSSQPHVARRIAVGYVRAHLWKFCSPRWETVVLC